MKALEEKINAILEGIDSDELNEEVEGWWETSTGAKFGANKLKELKDCVAKEVKDIAIEFSIWVWHHELEEPFENNTNEELFDQFIKERYK